MKVSTRGRCPHERSQRGQFRPQQQRQSQILRGDLDRCVWATADLRWEPLRETPTPRAWKNEPRWATALPKAAYRFCATLSKFRHVFLQKLKTHPRPRGTPGAKTILRKSQTRGLTSWFQDSPRSPEIKQGGPGAKVAQRPGERTACPEVSAPVISNRGARPRSADSAGNLDSSCRGRGWSLP